MPRHCATSTVACWLAAVLLIAAVGCGGPSASPTPTSPSSPSTPTPTPTPAPQPPHVDPATLTPRTSYTIGFSSVPGNRAPFLTHEESGLTITALSGDWISLNGFIEFFGPPGVTVTGEVRVTAGGAPFWVTSADFYSSTTKIPYVLEGFLNSEPAFTVVDVIGNTFGAFARRPNPNAGMPIQELRIRLSNPSAPCCGNPMGIDNIVIRR